MDDYLAKPIEITRLMKVLDRWLPHPDSTGTVLPAPAEAATPVPSTAPPAGPTPATATLDTTILPSLVGDDPDLLRQIYRDFQRSAADDLATLRRAAAGRDADELARAGHRVCGASRSVGATALAQMAEDLQRVEGPVDWVAVDKRVAALDSEWQRLSLQLQQCTRLSTQPEPAR
jgi:HPt (histidine-containing phosphotransfer) domain-containing protein